jgi:DNA-3-methyladenine glycosylase II
MKFILKPKPPYDFNLHPRFFGFDKPCPEVYKDGIWKRALRLKSDRLVPIKVRMIGNVENPKLEVQVFSEINPEEKSEVLNKLSWMFSVNEDLTSLYAFMEKDPLLRRLKQKLYGLRPFRYPTVYEGTIKSIIQQQISLIASMHMIYRLIKRFGDKITVGKEEFYEFPSPKSLSQASIEELRRCGLSMQKSTYIKEFSEKVANNEFNPETLKFLSSEEIIEKLTKFKGVGKWTAELVIVTSTRKEALPADDLGARRAVSKFCLDEKPISGDELREFAKKWGRFAGIITYYLICAERLKQKYGIKQFS